MNIICIYSNITFFIATVAVSDQPRVRPETRRLSVQPEEGREEGAREQGGERPRGVLWYPNGGRAHRAPQGTKGKISRAIVDD